MKDFMFKVLRLIFPVAVLYNYKIKAIRAIRCHIEILMQDGKAEIDCLAKQDCEDQAVIAKKQALCNHMDKACTCLDELLSEKPGEA